MRTALAAWLLAAGLGCTHVVTGLASLPYAEGAPPPSLEGSIDRTRVSIPGMELDVDLWNRHYTSAHEAAALNRPRRGRYLLRLALAPAGEGFTLDPLEAVLQVDGERERPVLAEVRDSSAAGRPWPYVTRYTAQASTLARGSRTTVILHFLGPVPLPDQDIRLDLGRALPGPGGAKGPVIRFRTMLWKASHVWSD
ncbi:MAG TPA: hypothetical protein VK188_17775 [Holophaga sp.]|nr:hypothetical protein [Holophaga sp.]